MQKLLLQFKLVGTIVLSALLLVIWTESAVLGQVNTVSELVDAINNGSPGDEVLVSEGVFELTGPLKPKDGMVIKGAGKNKTIIRGANSWTPGTDDLPDGETSVGGYNNNAYLFDLDEIEEVTITSMRLEGPNLHGAVLGVVANGLELSDLHIENFLWSSVRVYATANAKIHDVIFVDAGGKYGRTGGAIYATFLSDSEIWNNDISKSSGLDRNFYGIKGYQFTRTRIHHNTIKVGFSIELPFAGDSFVEIDHNYLVSVISLPKSAGGEVPEGGYTFHIHHNYTKRSYSLEWPRNGAEVDHNLFDFPLDRDDGNLISNFSSTPSEGPTRFHNNLIKNPGRGIMWSTGVYNNFYFYNNHVIANRTVTPRTEGFFEFNKNNDFSTVEIRDNIIECNGVARALMRNEEGYSAIIRNNQLINVSDTDEYANPQTGAVQGPTEALQFTCGAQGEYTVDGWEISESNGNTPPANADQGLNYTYYEGSFSQLPNFASLTPESTGTVENFDISPRKTDNNFAFKFSGLINVPSDGTYTFYTTSDDGSQLFIDGQLVVDNDGLHPSQERSGSVVLEAGKHTITVTFFEKGGNQVLAVNYQGPNVNKQPIPNSVLSKSSSSAASVTIYAAGQSNTERMELLIDGESVKTWNNIQGDPFSRDFRPYTYQLEEAVEASQVRVAFTNDDGTNRDLRIDKIVIDGITYQTESSNTYSLGSWTQENNCGGGFKQREWLHCSGYFAYSQNNARSAASDKTPVSTELAYSDKIALYPNPGNDVVTIRYQGTAEGKVTLDIVDVYGHQMPLSTGGTLSSQNTQIDISRWPAGLYFVKIRDGVTTTQRLIIAR